MSEYDFDAAAALIAAKSLREAIDKGDKTSAHEALNEMFMGFPQATEDDWIAKVQEQKDLAKCAMQAMDATRNRADEYLAAVSSLQQREDQLTKLLREQARQNGMKIMYVDATEDVPAQVTLVRDSGDEKPTSPQEDEDRNVWVDPAMWERARKNYWIVGLDGGS